MNHKHNSTLPHSCTVVKQCAKSTKRKTPCTLLARILLFILPLLTFKSSDESSSNLLLSLIVSNSLNVLHLDFKGLLHKVVYLSST
jgi:hypothetical protein